MAIALLLHRAVTACARRALAAQQRQAPACCSGTGAASADGAAGSRAINDSTRLLAAALRTPSAFIPPAPFEAPVQAQPADHAPGVCAGASTHCPWWHALTSSGAYGDPPSLRRWGAQMSAWVAATVAGRLCVAGLVLAALPLLRLLAAGLDGAFASHPTVLLFFVMVTCPLALNLVQAWVQDSALSWRQRRRSHAGQGDCGDGDDGDGGGGSGGAGGGGARGPRGVLAEADW